MQAEGELCASCLLTRTRPNDGDADALIGFAQAEGAKRRLLFELAQLELPVESWRERDGDWRSTCCRARAGR